jgi:hypothetical protein
MSQTLLWVCSGCLLSAVYRIYNIHINLFGSVSHLQMPKDWVYCILAGICNHACESICPKALYREFDLTAWTVVRFKCYGVSMVMSWCACSLSLRLRGLKKLCIVGWPVSLLLCLLYVSTISRAPYRYGDSEDVVIARSDMISWLISSLSDIGIWVCVVCICSISSIMCCRFILSAFSAVSPCNSLFRNSHSSNIYFQLIDSSLVPECSALNEYCRCVTIWLLIKFLHSITILPLAKCFHPILTWFSYTFMTSVLRCGNGGISRVFLPDSSHK